MFKCKRGDMPSIGNGLGKDKSYNPVGDTDSEKIFCSILNALKEEFSEIPSLPDLHAYLSLLLDEIVEFDEEGTILNFLLSCGEHIRKFKVCYLFDLEPAFGLFWSMRTRTEYTSNALNNNTG
jgi:predicted glutamine amidotransferase